MPRFLPVHHDHQQYARPDLPHRCAMKARAGFALAFVLAAGVPACGEDGDPEMMVSTWFRWNEDPGSVDEIGYQVSVDVGWPSRFESCFDLSPGLHVTVNGSETTSLGV